MFGPKESSDKTLCDVSKLVATCANDTSNQLVLQGTVVMSLLNVLCCKTNILLAESQI